MLTPSAGNAGGSTLRPAARLSRFDIRRMAENGCHRPLLPVCAGFIAGCLASDATSGVKLLVMAAIAVAIGVVLVAAAPRARFAGLAVLCGLTLIGSGFGAARTQMARSRRVDNALTAVLLRESTAGAKQIARITGEIAAPLHATARGGWLLLDVNRFSVGASRHLLQVTGDRPRVFVSLPDQALNSFARAPQVGDAMQVDGIISPVTDAKQTALAAGFDDWLVTQNVSASLIVKPVGGSVTIIAQERPSLATIAPRIAERFHIWCDERLRSELPEDAAALASGILLGERFSLTPSQSSAFAATGCAHLLATAGLHVGILALMLELLLRALTVPRKLAALSLIGIIWLYALAAGDRAAVARAACVATLYYGAILLERAPDLLSSLSFCALALLWGNPSLLQDAGFQLSFGTVLGLIAVMPVLMQEAEAWTSRIANTKVRRLAHRLIEIECLALAAQAVSAPLVAIHFNQVSLLGLFANLAACPLMFLIVPVALLSLIGSSVWSALGTALMKYFLAPLVQALFGLISWFASKPACAVSVSTPTPWTIALYYALLFTACLLLRTRNPHEAGSPHNLAAGTPPAVSSAAPAGPRVAAGQESS